jgi:hypothetical protein
VGMSVKTNAISINITDSRCFKSKRSYVVINTMGVNPS